MASVINSNEEYGHDMMFVDKVLEEHKCVLCHLVLRDPLQIMTCGHRFCSPCFNRMNTHAQQTNIDLACPVDRKVVVLGKVFEDRGIARSIGNLKTMCENQKQGCDWVGDLRDFQKHQDECIYQVLEQINKGSLQDGNQDDHKLLLNEILLRLGKCEDDLKAKEKRLEMCENDLLVKEKDIAHCKITIEEMKDNAKVREQDIKLLKSSNLQLQNEINFLSEKNVGLSKKTDIGCESAYKKEEELRTKVSVLEQKVADLNDILNTNNKQNELVTLDYKNIFINQEFSQKRLNMINEKVRHLEEWKDNAVEHMRNLENISFLNNSFNNNSNQDIEFRWVMTDYKTKFEVGDIVWSPAFYTGIKGYCVHLKVRKEKLGVSLHLCRDRSYQHPIVPFNNEFTLGEIKLIIRSSSDFNLKVTR